MEFNWDNFTEEDFVNYCAIIENGKMFDNDCMGCVRIGDLCFDLVVREYNHEFVLDYDLYVGGLDDGYGYGKENYPYTAGGGGTFEDALISLSYDDFVKQVEEIFTNYIYHFNYSENYNLVDKANQPLHIW